MNRFGCIPSVWDNLRSDLRLRNTTIYAQWASVFAAVLLYIPMVYGLYYYFSALPSAFSREDWKWLILATLRIPPMSLFFPLAPLALELPHYIQRKPFLYLSIVSWFTMLLYETLWIFFYVDEWVRLPLEIQVVKFSLMSFLYTIAAHIAKTLWYPGPPELTIRFGVNVLYCGQSVMLAPFLVEDPRERFGWLFSLFLIVTTLFGIAAVLYGIAGVMRHTWVSSRLLGGTGIEPIVLMLPGIYEPSHQSVGDEAREGAIRL